MVEAQKTAAEKRKQLQEDLEFNNQPLNSLQDVKDAVAKVYNLVAAGLMKRDKAGTLIQLLQLASKLCREQTGPRGPNVGVVINVDSASNARLQAAFRDPKLIDQFLLSDEHLSVKMIEDLDRAAIDVTATPVPPETMKVEAKELADLLGVKKAEVIDLLGTKYGDSAGLGYVKPEPVNLLALPEPEPEPVYCNWMTQVQPKGDGTAIYVYTCTYCGQVSANRKKEKCSG